MTVFHVAYPPELCGLCLDDVLISVRAIYDKKCDLEKLRDQSFFFCKALSEKLLNDGRARLHPELQSLGFWLRPSSISDCLVRYRQDYENCVRVPVGIVFQIPPRNVQTLFVYGLVISLLSGNVTCVRLPLDHSEVQDILLTLIQDTLNAGFEDLRCRLFILRYDRDDDMTEKLSSIANLRMVWGGDATTEHVRSLPLPPLSHHISFCDRYSMCALGLEAYDALADFEREALVLHCVNDIYLFDQFACSSPRLILWVGDGALLDRVTVDFYNRLAQFALKQGYDYGASEAVMRQNAAFLAMHDCTSDCFKNFGPMLSVVGLSDFNGLTNFRNEHYGYGLLLEAHVQNLSDFSSYVIKKDQTLSIWGLREADVANFVREVAGHGIDRIVPVGQALVFDPIWDGINLFEVMTRLVSVHQNIVFQEVSQ